MAKTTTSRLGQTRWSSGTDTVRRVDFDTDAANLESKVTIYAQGLLSARPSAGVSGRFYILAGESDPKLNGRVFYDNGSTWSANKYLNDAVIESTAAGNTALTVKAAASPTVDSFKITASDDSVLMRVTSTGVISNQSSLGVSGGAYLGNMSTHDAAGSFISVSNAKPVLVIKGAASQAGMLISGRDSFGAETFSVTAAGVGTFNGALTAATVTSNGAVNSTSLVVSGVGTITNLIAKPSNANNVSLTLQSYSNHLNNVLDVFDPSNARVARITPEGSFATNSRVVIGNNNGNSTSPTYASNTAALWVSNSYPTAPVARFVANPLQSGRLIDAVGSDGNSKFYADNSGNGTFTGNINSSGNLSANTGSFGATNSIPTPSFDTYQTPFEIITGTSTGTYDEYVVLRHANQDNTAVSRSVGLRFKLSGETTSAESAKWAGISSSSSVANSTNPTLNFLTNDTFYWFGGGGSNQFMSLIKSGGDTRLTVPRISLTSPTAFDSTSPALLIGTIDNQHMQFSSQSINSFTANNADTSTLNLQNNGGVLNLGSASAIVNIASRGFGVGSNSVYFGGTTPSSPQENDWWFDHTGNGSIKVRNASAWVTIAS